MVGAKDKILWSAATAGAGVSGLVLASNCPHGGACTGCLGCAGVGVGILLLLAIQRIRKGAGGGGPA